MKVKIYVPDYDIELLSADGLLSVMVNETEEVLENYIAIPEKVYFMNIGEIADKIMEKDR